MELNLLNDIDEIIQESIEYALEQEDILEKEEKDKEDYEKKHGKSIRHYIDEISRLGQIDAATGGIEKKGQGKARVGPADWVQNITGDLPPSRNLPNDNDNVIVKDTGNNMMGMYVVVRKDNRNVYLGKEVGFERQLRDHDKMPRQLKIPVQTKFAGGEKPSPSGGKQWFVKL